MLWHLTQRVRLRVTQLVSVVVLAAVMVAAVAVWVSITLDGWQQEQQRKLQATLGVASMLKSSMEAQLLQSISATRSVATFIAGAAAMLPNHTGTVAERMSQTLNPDAFVMVAKDLLQTSTGLYSLQIQPSAVIKQVYPPGTAPIGLDLLATARQSAGVLEALQTAQTVVTGPLHLVEGPLAIIVRTPVFLSEPRTIDSWWGMAACVITLDSLFQSTGIEALGNQGYSYVLEFYNPNTKAVNPIANNTQGLDRSEAVNVEVHLPDGIHWDLYVLPQGGLQVGLSVAELLSIVGVAIAIVVGLAMLFIVIRWYHKRQQRDISSAPKAPPFILLFTDIESSTSLWMSAPEAMAAALRIHNAIVRRVIKRFGAYECKTIGDSFMIACSTVEAGLNVAVELQRALRACADWRHEICDFYHVPWMGVRVGAHFCTDVQCLFDEVSRGYDYVGNDVNKTARVEAKALGGEILISKELHAEAVKLDKYTISFFGTHVLRGIETPQRLYRLHLPSEPPPLLTPRSRMWQEIVPSATLGDLNQHAESTHSAAEAVVNEWLHLSSQDCNEPQLLQFVLLCTEVLQIGFSPLVGSRKRDVMESLCDVWGIAAASHSCLQQLGLRIAHLLQPRHPGLFSPRTLSPHVSPEHSFGSPPPPLTIIPPSFPTVDLSLGNFRRELQHTPPTFSFRSSCVVPPCGEDDSVTTSPSQLLTRLQGHPPPSFISL